MDNPTGDQYAMMAKETPRSAPCFISYFSDHAEAQRVRALGFIVVKLKTVADG